MPVHFDWNNGVVMNQSVRVGRGRWLLWAGAASYVALLGYIFYDGIAATVAAWGRAEYSHGYLIPLIALFLVWQKKNELATVPLRGSWAGVLVTVLGLGFYFLGELSTLYIIIQYAFLLTLWGLVLAVTGWQITRRIWVALFFLVFMIPLPNFIYNNLSSELQLISSQLGVAVIRFFGISVYLEGNVIDLGNFKLQVVEACSGLRYLFPLMSLAFICAYFYKAAWWKRALVFVSSIPITILMNSFRIGAIGVLVEYWGIEMAEGFLHDFEGWVIFMGCLLVLLFEMWLLSLFGAERSRPLRALFGVEWPGRVAESTRTGARRLTVPAMVLIVPLLATAVAAATIGERDELIPPRADFSTFPLTLGQWEGQGDSLDPIFIDALKFSDYILANYRKDDSGSVNFYVAYYASQRKGESAHSPRSCIPGGGWRIRDLSRRTIDGVQIGDRPLQVNRVEIRKGDYRQLVYYWFQQRGRVLTNEYVVKWYLFWDALTRHRTDGALVRLVTLVPPSDDIDKADARLRDFAHTVAGELARYVPM